MGVFDILPGFGGDGEATDADPVEDSGGSDDGAADAVDPAELTPADFRERAEAMTGRSDVPTLDFTVESLGPLDELAAGPPSAVDRVAYGSYLGETILREFGGEWVDEDGWHVAVELPDDRTTIAVFDAAKMSIAKEPVFEKVAARLDAEGAERTPETAEDPQAEDSAADVEPATEEPSPDEVVDSPSPSADTPHEKNGPDESEGPTSDGDADADWPGDRQQANDPSAANSPPAESATEDSTASTSTDSQDTDDAAGEATDETDPDAAGDGVGSAVETDTDRSAADDAGGETRFDPTDDAASEGTYAGDPAPDDTDYEPVAPDRYVVREAAEAFADDWPEWELDFTPESLPRLDTFVDDQWDGRFRASSLADRSVDHENGSDPLTQLGAYYGEVLLRWLDGEWVATDDGDGAVAVPDVGEKTERVDVFMLARDCLVAPSTFAYRYDALVNRLHVDKNTVSDGRPNVFDAGRESLTSGDVITQFAEMAERFVEEWEKYHLDYSPRSLRDLDEIADALAREADCADVALGDGSDPESLWLTARATATGAYFAAVLLRHRGAQWRIGTDVELVIGRPDGESTVDPVATAADCLRGDGSFTEAHTSLRE